MRDDFDAKWNQLAQEVMSGMKEWRLQHPKATLREIEAALDERLESVLKMVWYTGRHGKTASTSISDRSE